MSSGKKQQAPAPAPAPVYGSSQQSQSFTPWDKAMPGYNAIASQMAKMAALGPQYVRPDAMTLEGLGALQRAVPGMEQANQAALGNYQFLSNAADVANNPYVQEMMGANQQQVNQNLQRNLLPGIQNAAGAAGAMGGSRMGLAQGQALGDTSRNLANTNAQMMLGAYGQGLGAQQAALAGLGGLQQGMLAPALALHGGGQIMEGYEQNRINAPWQFMQNMGAATQFLSPLGKNVGIADSGPAGSFGGGSGGTPWTGAPPGSAPFNPAPTIQPPGNGGKAPPPQYYG